MSIFTNRFASLLTCMSLSYLTFSFSTVRTMSPEWLDPQYYCLSSSKAEANDIFGDYSKLDPLIKADDFAFKYSETLSYQVISSKVLGFIEDENGNLIVIEKQERNKDGTLRQLLQGEIWTFWDVNGDKKNYIKTRFTSNRSVNDILTEFTSKITKNNSKNNCECELENFTLKREYSLYACYDEITISKNDGSTIIKHLPILPIRRSVDLYTRWTEEPQEYPIVKLKNDSVLFILRDKFIRIDGLQSDGSYNAINGFGLKTDEPYWIIFDLSFYSPYIQVLKNGRIASLINQKLIIWTIPD